MQSIHEWYKEQEASLKRNWLLQLQELKEELEKKQKKCKHKWTHVSNLFYALGETYDGDQCDHCGKQRNKRS